MRKNPQVLCGLRVSSLLLLYPQPPNFREQKITDSPRPLKSAQTLLKYSFFVTHQNLVPGRDKFASISLHHPQLPLPGSDGCDTQQSSQVSSPVPRAAQMPIAIQGVWSPAGDNLVSFGESCPDWPPHFWRPEARLSSKTRENPWTFKDYICFQQNMLCCNDHGSRCILSCFCASKEPQRLGNLIAFQNHLLSSACGNANCTSWTFCETLNISSPSSEALKKYSSVKMYLFIPQPEWISISSVLIVCKLQ